MSRRGRRRLSPGVLGFAFQATAYVSALGVIRVDARQPWLDAWLERAGKRRWLWLTADNPGGQLGACGLNAGRRERLRQAVEQLGLPLLAVCARADAGDWPIEEGWLIAGLGRARGLALGRRFRQLAVLGGQRGGRARLVWLAAN